MTSASSLSVSGAKSSEVSIRVDKLEDIVGDGVEAQISNYLDDSITCVHFARVAANHPTTLSLPSLHIGFNSV